MLSGSYVVSVDEKGRISIPARFREYLSNTFGDQLVLLSKDGSIFAYPLNEWKRRCSDAVATLSTSRREVRRYLRRLHGLAQSCEFDRQGRILLPAKMREDPGIGKEAVIVGLGEKLEIWDRGKWEQEVEGGLDEESVNAVEIPDGAGFEF